MVRVEVSAPRTSLEVGQTMQLSAMAKNASGAVLSGKSFTWSSSSDAVAQVSTTGLVTGRGAGSVTITASTEGKSGGVAMTITRTAVATITLSPPSASLSVGSAQQLSATATDASGNVLTGRSISWSSSAPGVASVDSSGMVRAVAQGTATITATSEGKSATAQITINPVAVASITVSPSTATLNVGSTQQFTVVLKDASGNVLTGRVVAWSSSNTAVATVGSTGLVTAKSAGSAIITATSEGKSDTAGASVVALQAARVEASPRFATLDVGGSTGLKATAYDASGNVISGASVSWTSLSTSTASVSTSGSVSGASAGQASIVAKADAATDTVWVAVLGAKSLLSTAFPGGQVKAEVKPGQTITVPVMLDLSKVSANGDLGAVEFELKYDPAVLQYQSATAGVQGSPAFNVPTAGTFKFSFAGTNPQGSAKLTLVTITFQLSSSAAVGIHRALDLSYGTPPADTSFNTYEVPIAMDGRIRVVSP